MADVSPQPQVTSDDGWARLQFQKALKHLALHGILPDGITVTESRVLAPLVALWKITAVRPQRQSFWVLSGDLPTDVMAAGGAATAREALRHFAMSWQLKAEQLRSAESADAAQKDYAELLEGRAVGLYKLFDADQMWPQG